MCVAENVNRGLSDASQPILVVRYTETFRRISALAASDDGKAAAGRLGQVRRPWLDEIGQIGLAKPAGMALMGARAGGRDRFEDVGHQRVGAAALGERGEPVAADPRAIAASEADDHERVVAEAKLTGHENRMGTMMQTSRPSEGLGWRAATWTHPRRLLSSLAIFGLPEPAKATDAQNATTRVTAGC